MARLLALAARLRGTPDGQALACLLERTRTLEDLARRTYRVLPILAGRVGGVGMAKLLTDYDAALGRYDGYGPVH